MVGGRSRRIFFPAQIELKTRKDFIVERNARSGVKLWRICGPSDHGRGKNPVNIPARRLTDQGIIPIRIEI
uniref:Uncharacterized protein n=1 Tax=Brassica campestris TaxID=3711 RepID=M4DVC9_BRACM